MGVTAVICEYNPFHSGHEKQIRLIKRARPDDAVICLMSRFFCQRGEAAVFAPAVRARCALAAGADLVLGLSASDVLCDAGEFAENGVIAADAIGADTLCFGSESGDVGEIVSKAEEQMSGGFLSKVDAAMKSDATRSRASVVSELTGSTGSNDILGVEYVKAIKKHGFGVKAEAIKRDGGYLSGGSAFDIRNRIFSGGEVAGVPGYAADAYRKEMSEGRTFRLENAARAVLAAFRSADADSLGRFRMMNREIAGTLIKAASSSESLEEMLCRALRKRYSASRLRRAVVSAMLRIERGDAKGPAFLTLLGLSSGYADRFSAMKKECGIPIVSRLSEARAADPGALETENRAAGFYALCGGDIMTGRLFITEKPAVL